MNFKMDFFFRTIGDRKDLSTVFDALASMLEEAVDEIGTMINHCCEEDTTESQKNCFLLRPKTSNCKYLFQFSVFF
jgi:hypothetical protein